MPTDAEITFADHMGRFYARRYSFPPMVGRLLGYLAVCDPPEQTHRRTGRGAARQPQRDRGGGQRLGDAPGRPQNAGRRRADGPRPDRSELAAVDRAWTSPSTRSWPSWRARASRCCGTRPPSGGRCCWRCRRSPSSWWSRCRSMQQEWEARREALVAAGRPPGAAPGRGEAADERDARKPAIVATGVRKSFGETVVLDGVDLTVAEGTIFALLGPNGAGKTTIVRILSTLIRADSGAVSGRRPRRCRRPGRRARLDRRHRPVLGGRRAADRRGEPASDGRPEPSRTRSGTRSRRRAARAVRSRRRGGPAGVDLLRRDAPPPRPGDDARRLAAGDLPRRADDRARPARAAARCGTTSASSPRAASRSS